MNAPKNFARQPFELKAAVKKLGADVGDRAHKMPRGAALLYRNRTPRDTAAPHYRGVTKLCNGDTYWVALWVRSLRGEPVLEIKLIRKEDLP
jgi:hypothetical protein